MNPLLEKWETVLETAPFEEIKTTHFLPAIEEGIKLGKEDIAKITENKEAPTFENTIVALDLAGKLLDRASTIFFNLNSAETNDEIQNLARKISPKLTEYSNDILLNKDLFERILTVYEQRDSLDLDVESQTLLRKSYKSFVRNGAGLEEVDKEKLRAIDKELSQLSLTFGEHLLKETNDFKMVISDEAELEGLPDSAIEAAAIAAKERDLEGKWVFTLDFPSYMAYMTYAKNRARREELFKVFASRGCKGDELDNSEIVKKIVALRSERAKLLGYATHADFVLEERMAESPKRVYSFLEDLLEKGLPAAKADVLEVEEYAKKLDGIDQLQRWDFSYYSEKLKKEKFTIDDEVLKPYFQLEKVVEGVFGVANKLFGLVFTERKNIQVYHPDVTAYEVTHTSGRYIGVYYADYFPRAGKRNGAWMTSYRGQSNYNEVEKRPHVSIVCNFTKPTTSRPSLLTFNEVTTLFHEFGHALHGLLADSKYEGLSGTSVFWDFVELPSQVLENWAYEKECLDMFAIHYETGEKIPEELINKIKDSAKFMEGYATVRQLSFGLLDMAWHQGDGKVEDVMAFEKEAIKRTDLFPEVKGTTSSCAFAHIFQGGYSAGYYSYKWAEVLDADAFEYFKEEGIFNKEVAEKFRENILSAGGSEHPMTLYKRFRGKEPSPDALLKRAGLLN
ncbi:M3 family metallopeptidase [Flammeovirgaceae bacterium SG7u.111]|nr:M3 family metallopeptidase [Flammeovirgaceae bacterium SG7u.132]WPO35280.1 M3 family metallopeptidase [Flammeovirgaceae bacterium SG7u.111]